MFDREFRTREEMKLLRTPTIVLLALWAAFAQQAILARSRTTPQNSRLYCASESLARLPCLAPGGRGARTDFAGERIAAGTVAYATLLAVAGRIRGRGRCLAGGVLNTLLPPKCER